MFLSLLLMNYHSKIPQKLFYIRHSKLRHQPPFFSVKPSQLTSSRSPHRYELETDPAAWAEAERQVQRRVQFGGAGASTSSANGPDGPPPADVTVSVRVAEHDKREISSGGAKHAETEARGGKNKNKDKDKDKDKEKKATGVKRKVETADDIYAQEIGNKLAKRGKKSKSGGRRGVGGR